MRINNVIRFKVQPSQHSGQIRNASEFHIKLPHTSIPDVGSAVLDLQQHHMRHFEELSPHDEGAHSLFEPSQLKSKVNEKEEPSIPHVVMERTITLEHAEDLLHQFREQCHYFPFVVLREESTVRALARDSPFLLLAILSVASNLEVPLHHQLDHEFRRILSSKVVFEGQRSLEYLQGLLIYLAWLVEHIHTF